MIFYSSRSIYAFMHGYIMTLHLTPTHDDDFFK
jgi:hypothetical protein